MSAAMTDGANGASPEAAPDIEVAIIGAGISGLGMGAALLHAGIDDFLIFERAGDVGGTWRDNTYPGIGVDIPTFAYQFSYELKPDWSRFFAKGHEVKEYVDDYVVKYRLEPHIRLESEVASRTWDDGAHLWRLTVNGEEVTARFVVSAIGAFVDPKPPGIEGIDDFGGKIIHSARWDHGYDLAGKRVAIVGTGASAVQIIPEIAREVGRLDVYQRTPIWISPKFDPKIPGWLQGVFRRVPLVQRAMYEGCSAVVEFLLTFMVVNYGRFSAPVHQAEARCRRWLEVSVDDPEVRAKLTPDYNLGCKRPSISNTYLRAFNRENVELVTDGIERVIPGGIRTADGAEREVDVIVLATGFRLASDPENFRRTPVRGRDGFDLAAHYEQHRLKAYEGISMPGLPNHFMMFGPHAFTGAAWHVLVQNTSRHVVRVLEECRRREATAVEVTPEATERFFGMIERRLRGSLWEVGSCSTANSYYYDHHGDTPYLRPTSSWQARRAAARFPLDDYRYERRGNGGPVVSADRARASSTL
jgi:cation diffusion facilitator CzcD-associated flavoprotein CzcO